MEKVSILGFPTLVFLSFFCICIQYTAKKMQMNGTFGPFFFLELLQVGWN